MRSSVVAAMEIVLVRRLDAMTGIVLPGAGPAGDTAVISKGAEIKCIDGAFFLENVKHLFRAFVHEGVRPNLDADGRSLSLLRPRFRKQTHRVRLPLRLRRLLRAQRTQFPQR